MNALRLPALLESLAGLARSDVILTGGGSFGRKDAAKSGATSCHQAEERSGNVSLSDRDFEFGKSHEEINGVIQKDADQLYLGKCGHTDESLLQAASFDWDKAAAEACQCQLHVL